MVSRQQTIDALGLHLLAAELAKRGFLVAPASRNSLGADLFAADPRLATAWTIHVKVNERRTHSWPLAENYRQLQSSCHIYVFMKLNGEARPDYYIASSQQVARDALDREQRTGIRWRSYPLKRAENFRENWEVFGSPASTLTAIAPSPRTTEAAPE